MAILTLLAGNIDEQYPHPLQVSLLTGHLGRLVDVCTIVFIYLRAFPIHKRALLVVHSPHSRQINDAVISFW
jgi:hypothetical protein